jgi:hypothetical protein
VSNNVVELFYCVYRKGTIFASRMIEMFNRCQARATTTLFAHCLGASFFIKFMCIKKFSKFFIFISNAQLGPNHDILLICFSVEGSWGGHLIFVFFLILIKNI